MTTRFVDGTGAGSNSYNGLAAVYDGVNGPKATLNGAEDTPVVAGDLVHVRPADYPEVLTVDVSGTIGNAIEYRGDFAGLIWSNPTRDVVRITGSNDNATSTRANCILASARRNYRTFCGLHMDGCHVPGLPAVLLDWTDGDHVTVQSCSFDTLGTNNSDRIAMRFQGANQAGHLIDRVFVRGYSIGNSFGVTFSHSANVSDAGHVIRNSIILGAAYQVNSTRVGGITVDRCRLMYGAGGVLFSTVPAAGQVMTCTNSILTCLASYSFYSPSAGYLTENYNHLLNCGNRTNVSAGANSTTTLDLLDMRWWYALLGGGTVLSPFDLADHNYNVERAGRTSGAYATDARGAAQIGSYIEPGPLEYDSALLVEAGGGGAVAILPARAGMLR